MVWANDWASGHCKTIQSTSLEDYIFIWKKMMPKSIYFWSMALQLSFPHSKIQSIQSQHYQSLAALQPSNPKERSHGEWTRYASPTWATNPKATLGDIFRKVFEDVWSGLVHRYTQIHNFRTLSYNLQLRTFTLLGTNISHPKALVKMIFPFPRWDQWDMLVPWRAMI